MSKSFSRDEEDSARKSSDQSTSISSSKSVRAEDRLGVPKTDVQPTVEPVKQVPIVDVDHRISLLREHLQPYENNGFWLMLRYSFLILFWISWFLLVVAVIRIRVVIDFPVAAVDTYHEWFQAAAGDFSDFFIWIKNKTIIDNNRTVDCEKGRCFKSTPDDNGAVLNWHDKALRMALLEEVKFWIDRQVDGFHLASVEHLVRRHHHQTGDFMLNNNMWGVDSNTNTINLRIGQENTILRVSSTTYPADLQELDKIIEYLKEFIFEMKRYAEDRDLFVFASLNRTSTKKLTAEEFESKLTPESSGFDAIQSDKLFYHIHRLCKISCLRNILKKSTTAKRDPYPWYTLDSPTIEHLTDRLGDEAVAQMFNLLFLSLPGSVTIYYGDEIGMMDYGRYLLKYFSDKTLAYNPPMPWTKDESEIDLSPERFVTQAQETTEQEQMTTSTPITLETISELYLNGDPAIFQSDNPTPNVEAQLATANSHLSMVRRITTARQSEYAIMYGDYELGPWDEDLLVVNVSSHLSPTHFIVLLHFGDENTYDLTDEKFDLYLKGRQVTLVAGTENLFQRGALVNRQVVDLTKIELRKNEALVVRVKKV